MFEFEFEVVIVDEPPNGFTFAFSGSGLPPKPPNPPDEPKSPPLPPVGWLSFVDGPKPNPDGFG